MLTELSHRLDSAKFADLKARVSHSDTRTALAGEGELSVLWAIAKVAHLVLEPVLPNGHRPDALSEDLFHSQPSIIEVRALSDDSFSGKEAMDRTANVIASYADRLRKDAGKHLYFEFDERSYWTTRYHRERCVDPAFKLTPYVEAQLRNWITAADWPTPAAIRLTEGRTNVVVSWKTFTVPLFRTFCRMPAVAYDLEDNPIYKALKKKAKQVKEAPANTLRCVILVDSGCGLLMRLHAMRGLNEVDGAAIIRHAIAKLSIDAVIVLSPYRSQELMFGARTELRWNVTCFDRRKSIPDGEYDRVKALAAQLPRPHFEGHQARDIHKQGGFASNARNWHLPTEMTTRNGGRMTIKLSAMLLHEYLAGTLDADGFKEKAFGRMNNMFTTELMRGHSIQGVQFESAGTDEDDDYVIIDLDIDRQRIAKKE